MILNFSELKDYCLRGLCSDHCKTISWRFTVSVKQSSIFQISQKTH